jgi:hypothetical protein
MEMIEEVVTTPRVFQLAIVRTEPPVWEVKEDGVYASSRLFKSYMEAFNTLSDALAENPDVRIQDI